MTPDETTTPADPITPAGPTSRRRPHRSRLLPVAAGVAFAFLGSFAAGSQGIGSVAAADGACTTPDGVTVIVDFRELGGGVVTRCAEQPVPDGFAALRQAGFTPESAVRQPGFLCRIDGKPANDPCVNTSPSDAYWAYFVATRGGEWTYSDFGAGRTPPPGSVEGWSFAKNASSDAVPQPGVQPPPPLTPAPTSSQATTTAATVAATTIAPSTTALPATTAVVPPRPTATTTAPVVATTAPARTNPPSVTTAPATAPPDTTTTIPASSTSVGSTTSTTDTSTTSTTPTTITTATTIIPATTITATPVATTSTVPAAVIGVGGSASGSGATGWIWTGIALAAILAAGTRAALVVRRRKLAEEAGVDPVGGVLVVDVAPAPGSAPAAGSIDAPPIAGRDGFDGIDGGP